ncbi:conserved hypothetical protein [Trichinella spiralis]|uniref:hypothetical protein n=1 Tax=Trichinella spiralis TaxID=6334 RepID=UPI0001EFDEAB|nr:conserved hypothetical protein [Trichinella spiralis]
MIRQRKLSKPTTSTRSMHTTHYRNPPLIFNSVRVRNKPNVSLSGSAIEIAPIVTQLVSQTCSRLPIRNYANECTIKRESTKHRRIITCVNVENANTVVDVNEPACRG